MMFCNPKTKENWDIIDTDSDIHKYVKELKGYKGKKYVITMFVGGQCDREEYKIIEQSNDYEKLENIFYKISGKEQFTIAYYKRMKRDYPKQYKNLFGDKDPNTMTRG